MKRIVLLVAVAAMTAAIFAVSGPALAAQEPIVDALGNPITIDYLGIPVHLVRDDSGNPIMVDGSGTPVSLSMDGSDKPVLLDGSGNPVSVDESGNPTSANDLTNALCSLLSPGDANALLVPGCSTS